MSVPNKEDLLALLKVNTKPCLSIYMCTDRLGAETQQNPIRLRNLLRQAEERLVQDGDIRTVEARAQLQPAHDLLSQSQYWRHMDDGLALFMARGFFREYRVPLGFDEQVIVSNRFHIRPLLPLLVGDGRFYVLALSQGGVRLYQGTRDSISPVELENVPANLNESRHTDEPSGNLQFHTAAQQTGGPGSERAAMYYGTGAADNNVQREIVRYFHEVDRGLRETLGDEQIPLVLAGVEDLLPMYREANSYPALIEEEIPTGTDMMDGQDLHDRAWPLVEPIFLAAREKAITLYRRLAGESSVKASSDLREVVPAAYYGRVGTLLLANGAQEWGSFDRENGTIAIPPGNGNAEDLFDLAAVFTLQNKGTVYTVDREQMPGRVPVAALFRY
jgi:hypothetical protein